MFQPNENNAKITSKAWQCKLTLGKMFLLKLHLPVFFPLIKKKEKKDIHRDVKMGAFLLPVLSYFNCGEWIHG